MQLRDYQQHAVDDVRISYQRGFKAPLLVAPTGAGKTVMFSHIASSAQARGGRVFIVAHRAELLRQISGKLREFNVDHGIIAAGTAPSPFSSVQVCSVHTLVRRLDGCQKPSLIIMDEAHHAVAGSWKEIINAFPTSKLLGVTATPERLDGKGLGDIFDHLVEGPSVASLIKRGFLTKPIYYAPPVQFDPKQMRTMAGDFNRADMDRELNQPHILGDAVSHYRKLADGTPAVAFCVNIQHANRTAEAFNAAGYRFETIDGTQTPERRKQLVDMLADGRLHGLASCDLISEGFDLPVVTTAILLRPTKSLSLHLQQIGRVLRVAPNKPNAIILDHVGNILRHGVAEESREWALTGRTKKDKDTYQIPATRQCPACYAVHERAMVCPQCGWRYENTGLPRYIEEREGELRAIDPEELKRQRSQEQANATSLDDLIALARKRGYKSPKGWARYVYESRQRRKTGKAYTV
jgi:superfamily II DNA or RNA helicase